ncbi:ABC transporter permease [Brevibacillus panacihumi W25]|uniref:ABC transporter permease n=1 Tax=Brevibacillus panacihumi W25 TaxID=1408254 RepID=V6MBF9_9BACL|nr:ABC transporter permease [Brevibacillus panacihumi]EST55547.1 ABC transporter permease [Brevibacillus panacihumi W25]
MIHAIRLEFYKLRRRFLYGMTVLFVSVELSWAFMAASMSFARNPDRVGWEPIIAMFASLNGLFLPILSAIVVSRICDMEHKGNTWKLLLTCSMKRERLYAAKYISACAIMLCVCVMQGLAIAAFGTVQGITQSVPGFLLVRFMLGTMVTSMAILALQQWLSIVVKNQAFALCLGMLGGFAGLVGDLFPAAVRKLLVWSYYSGLSPIAQNYTGNELQFYVRYLSASLPEIGGLMVVAMVIFLAGRFFTSRQEV